MEKFILTLVAALITTTAFADAPKPTPQQRAEEAGVKAKQAVLEAEAKAQSRAAEAARRASLTFTEARIEDGRTALGGLTWVGAQGVRGVANADGYVAAGIAYPAAYVSGGSFVAAEWAKDKATKAFDAPVAQTEVALKVGDKEVKATVPTPVTK